MVVEIHLANRVVFILAWRSSVVQIEVILGRRDVSRHGSAPVHWSLCIVCCWCCWCCFSKMRRPWRSTSPRPCVVRALRVHGFLPGPRRSIVWIIRRPSEKLSTLGCATASGWIRTP